MADLPEQAPNMNAKTFNLQQVKELFRNPTFIPFLMIWITHGIGGWGISFVLPTVIYELGISNTAISQVMTMVSFSSEASERLPLLGRGGLTEPCDSRPSLSFLSSFCRSHSSSTPGD